MNTEEDDEFKRIEMESGWRKRQIMAEDDDDIQDYKKPWVGLTRDEQSFIYDNLHNSNLRIDSFWVDFANAIGQTLKEKNT
jgi:hypothetical protein